MEKSTTKKINKSKKGKIIDIVSWVIVLLLFSTSLFLLLSRKANGTMQVFKTRYDVVLRTSMASRNPEHADFLKGTTQIQKMDVVKSKVVDSKTKLNVYDVVIFKDPKVGTNMHRIVDKQVDTQDEIYLQETIINTDGSILLSTHNAAIYTNSFVFTSATFEIYSESESFSDGYYFSINNVATTYNITSKKVGGSYCHKVTVNNSYKYPSKLTIVHSKVFEYGSESFKRLSFNASNGKIDLNGKKFKATEDPNIYEHISNIRYTYEIRGDAAKTHDGWFGIEDIEAKVVKVLPKAGYVVRYLTSIPGIIMLVGIGLIIVVTDFLLDYADKKKNKEELKKEIPNQDENKEN